MIDKNILVSSLNNCIDFLEGHQQYQDILLKWKYNLLDLNNDNLNLSFIENCITESVNKINQQDTLDEEILISPSKDKVYNDYEKTEEIKKDKNKTILDKKEIEEALQNDKVVGFFILESIIDMKNHKYLIDRYIVENDAALKKIDSLKDAWDLIWGGLKGLFNVLIKNINKGNSNIKKVGDYFKNISDKYKIELNDLSRLNPDLKNIKINEDVPEKLEDMLITKVNNLDEETKQIFIANLSRLKSNKEFGEDFNDYLTTFSVDSAIANKKLVIVPDEKIDVKKLFDYNSELLNSGIPKTDTKISDFSHIQDTVVNNYKIKVPINNSNKFEEVLLNKNEFKLLHDSINSQKSSFLGITWFDKKEVSISEIIEDINKNAKLNKSDKQELINVLKKLDVSTVDDIQLNINDFEKSIDSIVECLSADQQEISKLNDNEFLKYTKYKENWDIQSELLDTTEDMDVTKSITMLTIVGVSISLIIIITATLVTKYVKKTRYIKKNCRPGDKECLYNVKLMEFDKTLELLKDIKDKGNLTNSQKRIFDKKIKKLEELKIKLKSRKNKLLEKDKYIRMVAMNKSIKRI